MNTEFIQFGRVCLASRGRERGELFVIVGFPCEGYVLLADGARRLMSAPKKKRIKHIVPTPHVLEDVADRLRQGRPVYDFEIATRIRGIKEAQTGQGG